MNRIIVHAMSYSSFRTFIIHIICVGIFCYATDSSDAETYKLNLESAREIALKNNPDLIRSMMDIRSAEAAFYESKAGLYPSLSLDLIAPGYNESRSEQYIYEPVSGNYTYQWINTGDYRYQGSLNLEQKLPTGGTFAVSNLLYKREYFFGSYQDSLTTEYSNALRFSIEQPILQPNQVRMDYRRSLLGLESARLQRQIQLRDFDYLFTSVYYSLVRSSRQLQLQQEDYQRWRSSVKTAEDKFKSGLIPEVEVLKLQVELARREGALAAVRDAYLQAELNFKIFIGIDLMDTLQISIEVEEIEVPEGLVENALNSRQELKKAEIDVKNAEINYKQVKADAGINASLYAYYDLDSKEPSIDDIVDNFEIDRGISLNISVPLFNWGKTRNSVEARKISLDKTKYNFKQLRKQFIAELSEVERSLTSARQRLESARLAEQLAQKSYEMTTSRFESGAVTATDLIDAQISLNQAGHELLDSTIDYNIAAIRYKIMFFPQKFTGL